MDGTTHIRTFLSFSYMYLLKPGTMVEHVFFLAGWSRDPRPAFLNELKKAIGPKASVLVYYESFEKGQLKETGRGFSRIQRVDR